uniref:Transcription elongation factor NusA n=1 Tax=Ignisphaera aggregans TaxID=334771 RepID=A0A7C5TL80_9CREN
MRLPLDIICVKSGVLCPRCKRLIDSGVYSQNEVDIMKALLELEEDPSNKFLREATYFKSYYVDSIVIVVIEVSDSIPQSMLIKLGRALSEKLGLRIRVIRRSQDVKVFLAQIFAPARIQGIDSVWTPDGDVQHIIRISKYDARVLPFKISQLENLLTMIFNEVYRIKVI